MTCASCGITLVGQDNEICSKCGEKRHDTVFDEIDDSLEIASPVQPVTTEKKTNEDSLGPVIGDELKVKSDMSPFSPVKIVESMERTSIPENSTKDVQDKQGRNVTSINPFSLAPKMEEGNDEVEQILAKGIPEWDIEPPVTVVRRRKNNV